MSKVWLNSAGQVLVDKSGRPYLCDKCPCGGDDEPMQGSRKILKVNVDFSWTGAPSSLGEHSYLSWYVVWHYDPDGSTTQTATFPTGFVSYDTNQYAMRYNFFPDFSSGELKTSFEVIVEDTELSDNCKKIDLHYVSIFANLTATEAPNLKLTDNTTTELICETFDLEFE